MVGLRPGFDAQWDGPGSGAARTADRLIFSTDEDRMPASSLVPAGGEKATPDSVTHLTPWPQADNGIRHCW